MSSSPSRCHPDPAFRWDDPRRWIDRLQGTGSRFDPHGDRLQGSDEIRREAQDATHRDPIGATPPAGPRTTRRPASAHSTSVDLRGRKAVIWSIFEVGIPAKEQWCLPVLANDSAHPVLKSSFSRAVPLPRVRESGPGTGGWVRARLGLHDRGGWDENWGEDFVRVTDRQPTVGGSGGNGHTGATDHGDRIPTRRAIVVTVDQLAGGVLQARRGRPVDRELERFRDGERLLGDERDRVVRRVECSRAKLHHGRVLGSE